MTREYDEQRWRYNAKDCCYTYECMEAIDALLAARKLTAPYRFQMRMWRPVLRTMIRGIRIDTIRASSMRKELSDYASRYLQEVEQMVGGPLNPNSTPQMREFFYEALGLPRQFTRGKTKTLTCNDEALEKLGKKEPVVRPITRRIAEIRSCKTIISNALKPALGYDGRMRSSLNLAGTGTFRLSSSTDAFGSGMNLENIPKGDSDE